MLIVQTLGLYICPSGREARQDDKIRELSVRELLEKYSNYAPREVVSAAVEMVSETASPLIQKLKFSGLYITQVALRGRFHWQKHQKLAQLIQFCNLDQKFQFLKTSKLQFSTRSAAGGQYVTAGELHVLALREILLEQAHTRLSVLLTRPTLA